MVLYEDTLKQDVMININTSLGLQRPDLCEDGKGNQKA
jgi:hypothetical protein